MATNAAFYIFQYLLSNILTVIFACRWRKRFDVNLALIFLIVNISNLGFMLFYMSQDLPQAVMANKISYMGGCFLPMLVVFLGLRLCRIKVPKWMKGVMCGVSMIMYAGVLTTGILPIYYKTVKYEIKDGIVYLSKEYTAFHTMFNVVLFAYFVGGSVILIYTFIKKKDVSHKIVALLLIPFLLCLFGFWVSKFRISFDLMPQLYNISLVIYLVIMEKIGMYDIVDTGIEALTEEGDTGFISLDRRLNYIGSNETAERILPDLTRVQIDTCIKDYQLFSDTLIHWIDEFTDADEDGVIKDQFNYEANGRYYYVNVSILMDRKRPVGYQIFFMDNTKERQYVEKIRNYNDDLQKEVEEKTAHIVDMHNRLVLGMATMVESRDNSTGGHVRRTSDLVRMLVGKIEEDLERDVKEEIDEDIESRLNEEGITGEKPVHAYFMDVIKAAPMHDLGKIAVDDSILRKPGRFEPWEFEEMKKNASEGARIVNEILKDTDDKVFHHIAENVAHFHHERWDGSGYPKGLKGKAIPLEARIMAIADVYDALVSKRVYKEKMSFEKADGIIMEGMGTQFDKQLQKYYVAARPEFEAYYMGLDENEEPGKEELCQ